MYNFKYSGFLTVINYSFNAITLQKASGNKKN